MMNKAKGPLWHKKQKAQGIIPKGLRGIDREATWCTSHSDGWVYGHGSFTITSHRIPVVGRFVWMQNSASEAKRMWSETGHLKGLVDYVAMDAKADDQDLFREFKRQRNMTLITCVAKSKAKSENRKHMLRIMQQPKHKQIYKERAYKVEPMQGLLKDIFDLDRCWMRGNTSNRWLFAAMGVTVQMHQLMAFRENKSTWCIKDEVLG